jgi:cellulose synthase/poly-beta-1,6-N-acetylglucosamine synthase-like glycosyltransferase
VKHGEVYTAAIVLFAIIQVLYLLSLAVNGYFYSRWMDLITPEEVVADRTDYPPILLLYPVLREAEETMRTTMLSIAAAQDAYRPGHARVVAIPNSNDAPSIAALERLMKEFDFLEILSVPPTTDRSWAPIWSDWDTNTHAYWWHIGKRRAEMELPPKKTRQLVYALYAFANKLPGDDWLLSYLDADSAVPVDYFRIAAAGAARFDVVQLTNVAGNLMETWASSFHAMDHMAWDGGLYAHMTARGRHPFYVLGKGLFFKVADLVAYGGFNPWLTIEDPEVGMRLWTNGRRLGVSQSPLIEEVPQTFRGGITQRKRWVAGFFQSLHTPLALMGMSFPQRMRARLNLVPCLSLALNTLGLPLGAWVLIEASLGRDPVDVALTVLCVLNLVAAAAVLCRIFLAAWVCSAAVLHSRRSRLLFLLRVNPLFLICYWILWLVPLGIGLYMFMFDGGLVWQRTEKVDANHNLIREGGLELPAGGFVLDLREQLVDSRELVEAPYESAATSERGAE